VSKLININVNGILETIEYFGSVSSPLCVYKRERVCSQTQLCQLRCFNDYATLLTHISVPTGKGTVPPRSLSELPAARPQLGRRKRNMPLHNTSALRNFNLDT